MKKIGEATGAKNVFDEKTKTIPQRKALSGLVQALSQTNEKETAAALEKACGKHLRAATDFFYCALFERFGHAPYVTTEMVGRAFPEVKIPKPRGRMARK